MKHKTAKANVKTKTRLLSLLLAVLMMLFCFPVTALGTDEAEEPISETLEETADAGLSAFERGVGELSPEALESMTLNAADVPEVISAQAIAEKDHVLRLREQEENLNTVVFQNRDGGKTVYLYANPVKYVDANRNVKDKSTALKAENITLNGKTYSHSATENVFGQYYPTMPQNGVLITFGQYTVEMAPVITGILTLRDTAVANNKVTYNKVFGNGTSLVYTPTLSGVKEDIILQTYTGKSSFSFTLKTNGLAIVQTESDTFLADFEGNKVASLGKVIITDSANHTAYGSMTVAAKTEREEYTVTINAPTAFLTSATTVYPVTVDPTFVINETYESGLDDYGNAQYSTAIEDLCVYDGTANPVYDDIATIGNYSGNYKSAMLYRIKADAWSGMNLDAYVNNIRFGSASLNVEVDSLYSKIGVSVSPFYGSWNNGTSQNVESMFIDYQFDSNSNRTTINNNTNNTASINVTNIFKYWINNPNSVNYGMILYVDNTILSGTYQNSFNVYQLEESSSSVYISIEYSSFNGSYYINSLESGKFLTGSSVASVSQGIYNGPTYQGWTFTYQGANKYIISLTANTNRVLCVDDNFCIAIGSKSSMEESFYTWQLSFYEDTVTMYNIGSGEYLVPSGTNVIGSSMDDFYGHWRVCRTNAFVPLESVTIADIVMEVGGTATPTITPTPANATWVSASDFSWSSANASIVAVSVNGSVCVTTNNADGIYITATHLPSGRPETFKVRSFLPLSGYELDYEPEKWDSFAEISCNCYNYAINNQVYPGDNNLYFKQQMGEFYGEVFTSFTESAIYEAVCNDYTKYNSQHTNTFTFQRIGRYETCPEGMYKVALVIDPFTGGEDTIDYHWYRQDSDGYWSHKPGLGAVTCTDSSGKLIVDPQTADRGNYTTFCGYYAVSPWNNIWTETDTAYCYYDGDVYEYYDLIIFLINNGLLSYENTELESCCK